MAAPPPSPLDGFQVLKHSFDDATGRLRVDSTLTLDASTLEIAISHEDDSIRIGDGTSLVTTTTVGSKVALDVALTGSGAPVEVVVVGNGIGSDPTVANLNTPIANTEYSFVFPTETKKIRIKARNNSLLKYTTIMGQSGTTFISVKPGNVEVIENININTPLTLYFQSTAPEVIEFLYWV